MSNRVSAWVIRILGTVAAATVTGLAAISLEEKQPMSNSDWLVIEVLAWFGMGAFCYWMAGRKNRRPWLWAALGVLGGLFAVFVILVISEVEEPVEETEAIESSQSFG